MKLRKILFSALCLATAAISFSSCSSDDDYTATKMPTTAQAYFSNEKSYDFLLAENQNQVTVEVMRVKTEGPITVNLEVSDTTSTKIFNVPTSVTFADGENTAIVPITFDFNNLVADNSYALDLKLTSETSAYGNEATKVVVKYAPWSGWQPYGWQWPSGMKDFAQWEAAYSNFAAGGYSNYGLIVKGELPTYTYTQYMSGTYTQPVFYRESMLNPSLAQLMLYDWFYGVNLVIDWDKTNNILSVGQQWTGYNHSTYGQVFTGDSYTYWHDLRGDADVTHADFPCYWDKEKGRFVLDMAYFVSAGYFGYGPEIIQLPGYTQLDYSLSLTDEGTFKSKNGLSQVINMIMGADVSYIKYAWFAGEPTAEELQAKVNGIFDGSVESYETKESGRKVLAVEAEGPYYLVAVMYDAEGAKVGDTYIAFNVEDANAKTFEAAYVGDYTYSLLFKNDDGSPYVDSGLTLFQCKQDPTLFKIEHWGYDVDFMFTMQNDGSVLVAEQPTGASYKEGDPIFVNDLVNYSGGTNYGQSFYKDGVFNFALIYYCSAGQFGYGVETFALTGTASAKANEAMKVPAKRSAMSFANAFSSKSVSKKHTVAKHSAVKMMAPSTNRVK